jgi:hypothetical protein
MITVQVVGFRCRGFSWLMLDGGVNVMRGGIRGAA